MNNEEDKTISAIEETARFNKRMETVADIIIRKSIEEHPQHLTTTLQQEAYEVERVAMDEPVSEAPKTIVRENGDLLISVVEERIVVEKRLFLIEQIHIRKSTKTKEVEKEVILKKEVIDVERKENGGNTNKNENNLGYETNSDRNF
jgi:stress response protein YsnF